MKDAFLSDENYLFKIMVRFFIKALKDGALDVMGWKGGEIYAYKETGGSNLDMEDICLILLVIV